MARRDIQKKILNAATEIMLDQGIAKLSVRSISTLSGISTMGIYHHFDGKQGVLDALRIDGFELLAKAIDQVDNNQTSESAILSGTEHYLRFALENPTHYTLMFEPSTHGYSPNESTKAAANFAFSKLVELISALPNTNSPAKLIAVEVWALVHGFVGLKQQVTAELYSEKQWQKMVVSSVFALLQARQSET